MGIDRRDFLKMSVAAGLAAGTGFGPAEGDQAGVPKRALGRTGERVSVIGLGGIVLMGAEQQAADRIVRNAIDRGVNYFDVAPSYGSGEAEEKTGRALERYRDRVFLACKTARRDRAGAEEELQTSLKRLRTDHLDLYQLHGLSTKEEVQTALGPGGAMEAVTMAREKGAIRFIGFSAHSVDAALAAMEGFAFDTVLFPINWVCYLRGGFGPQVVKAAQDKGMGVLALKAMARGPWPEDALRATYPKCWYQPISDPHEAALALRFALSLPIAAAVPPGDESLFELALREAERFKPLSDEERKQLEALSAEREPLFTHPPKS